MYVGICVCVSYEKSQNIKTKLIERKTQEKTKKNKLLNNTNIEKQEKRGEKGDKQTGK